MSYYEDFIEPYIGMVPSDDGPWDLDPADSRNYGNYPTHWRQKDGKLIAVKDMSNGHLANTLRVMDRSDKGIDFSPWITVLQLEQMRRKNDSN